MMEDNGENQTGKNLEGGGSGRCPRITRNLPSDTQGTMKNQDT
jgi:hypothetical protein